MKIQHRDTERHVLTITVDNEAGILAKIAGLFTARGYNIDSLTVADISENHAVSRITIVTNGPPQVIATGGGAFMNPETRAAILEHCVAIWLDGEVELLAERAARSGNRPLLDKADPVGSLRRLAAIRNPVYAEAHLRVLSDRRRHEETVEEIVTLLKS